MIQYATLKFPDYTAAVQTAKILGFWDEDLDQLKTDGQSFSEDGRAFSWTIDEIGDKVIDLPAEINPETGEIIEEATYKFGYYVNVTGELPPQIEAFKVTYGSGGRVFAGTEPE
jgi:hypothetical protein